MEKKNIISNNYFWNIKSASFKEICQWFLPLSIIYFIKGFLHGNSCVPPAEILVMNLIFIVILLIQVFFIWVSKNGLQNVLAIFFSSGNLIFFNLILNDENKTNNLFYFCAFLFLSFVFVLVKHKKFYLIFFGILFANLFSPLLIYLFKGEGTRSSLGSSVTRAEKNIYLIGIDGMISQSFYHYIFGVPSEAHQFLYSLGYDLVDGQSPGFSTMETYGKMVTYDRQIQPRNAKLIFNNPNSLFYRNSKALGYKLKFVFFSNYFGANENKIFESYYPEKKVPLGFLFYTDNRWGWYSLRILTKFLPSASEESSFSFQKDLIFSHLYRQSTKLKWIHMMHLWYPGHTTTNYNSTNKSDYEKFKLYYQTTQKPLADFFKVVHEKIMQQDKNAIIVFWGDHGAYFLKGRERDSNGEKSEKQRIKFQQDKTSVLYAIYPKNTLDEKARKSLTENPELFFKTILESGSKN